MRTNLTTTAAVYSKRCPQCGRQYPADCQFCQDDAANLVEITQESGGGATTPEMPHLPAMKPKAIRVALSLAGLTVIGLALGIMCFGLGFFKPHGNAAVPTLAAPAATRSPLTTTTATAAPSPTTTRTWRRYRNSQLGFSMEVPEDWRSAEVSDLGHLPGDGHMVHVLFRSPDADVWARVDVDLAATGLDARGNWQDLDARFRKVYRDRYSLIRMEDIMVSGQTGSVWQFLLQKKGGPTLERLDVGTFFGGRRHAFLFLAPPARYGAWQSTFQHMIESIRWE